MQCSEQPWSQVLASVSAARRSPPTGVLQQGCVEATGEKVCIQKRRQQEISRFSIPPLLLARCLVDLLSRFAIIRRRNASWLGAIPGRGFMKRIAIALKILQYQRDHGLFSRHLLVSLYYGICELHAGFSPEIFELI
jgi:hypothetical protein